MASFTAMGINGNANSAMVCSVNNSINSGTSVKTNLNKNVWLNYAFAFVSSTASTTITCRLSSSANSGIYLDTVSVVIPC
jgi:hypothetical protein